MPAASSARCHSRRRKWRRFHMSSARAVEHEPRIESRRYGLERSKRGGRERNLPNRRRRLAVRLRYALDVRTGDVNDASRPVDVLALERSPLLRSHTCCGGEADRRAVDLASSVAILSSSSSVNVWTPRGGGGGF